MADTFNNDLRVREQEAGSNSGTWGGLLNTTISNLASAFGQGSEAIPNASTHTITLADGAADEARSMYLKCTGGGQACTVTLAPNTISKVWIISNETSFTLTFSQGSGANVAVAAGAVKMIVTDGAGSGAAVIDALSGLEGSFSGIDVTGTAVTDGLTVAGNLSVDGGTIKLDGNYPVGTGNVALGDAALDSNVSGAASTAIGANALTANTADSNTGIGYQAGIGVTSGTQNFLGGVNAGRYLTTGSYNVAVGNLALGGSTTTASNNTAVGYQALYANTTGTQNTALGAYAGDSITTGNLNVATGAFALSSNTTGGQNVAIGRSSLEANTTASNNTAVGNHALLANTTGLQNVAIGSSALASQAGATTSYNTAVGYIAGENVTTGHSNTLIGYGAGHDLTTGTVNVFVGGAGGSGPGGVMTTGSKNTILGGFSGNQGGLDIRTSSNNIVLSDGDGNPRLYFASNTWKVSHGVGGGSHFVLNNTDNASYAPIIFQNGGTQVGYVSSTTTSTAYVTSSDYRLKENVVEISGATERLKQLKPSRFNFIVDPDNTVDGFLAHEVQAIVPEAIHGTKDEVDADGNPVYQGIDQSKLVPLLVATIQELEARITALES